MALIVAEDIKAPETIGREPGMPDHLYALYCQREVGRSKDKGDVNVSGRSHDVVHEGLLPCFARSCICTHVTRYPGTSPTAMSIQSILRTSRSVSKYSVFVLKLPRVPETSRV
jgi:hypothetical protein